MKNINYSTLQISSLVILRVLIGWHLLYEGLIKVFNPAWSSAAFLESSQGPLAGFFHGLAQNETALNIVDFLNEWGLVFIGLSLILGLISRIGCIAGILLLFLYYISNPPFIGLETPLNTEGNYLIVNKNLIEMTSMFVLLLFPTSQLYGIDRFFRKGK